MTSLEMLESRSIERHTVNGKMACDMHVNTPKQSLSQVPCCLMDVVELCHWIVEHLRERIT